MNFFTKFRLLIVIVLFSSCGINDLDFEQIDDYSALRVFKTSLTYFTVDQKDFLDTTGAEITIPVDEEAGFLFFINNPSLRSNLEKIEIELEIDNQFDRDFKGKIQFLDDNDIVTHEFDEIFIEAKNSQFKDTLSLLIKDNTRFLTSSKVNFEVELQASTNGSVLDPNVDQTLGFKSVAVYYIRGKLND